MTVDKNVTVDLSHVQPHRKITIHENDVNSVYIVISVVNNGSSVSLSGLTIKYDAVINDFLAEQDASGSVDTTNNTIRIPVTTNMTAMSGILRIDIRIISGTEVLHTQTITAIVEKSVVDGSTVIDFSGINIVMRLNALESDIAALESDIATKMDVNNKVTSLSRFSSDTQYPSAKCVYDFVTGQIGDLSSKMDLASINPTAEQIAAMSTGQIYDETDDGVVTIKGGTELLGVLIAQFNPEYGIKGKVGQIARYGNNFYQCFGQNEQGTYVWKLISFAGSDVIKARTTTTGASGDYIISSSTTLQVVWELFTKYHCVKVALTSQYGTPTGQVCWITNVTGNNKEKLSAFMLPELSSSSSPVAPVYQKIHFLEQNASSPSDTLRLVTKYVYPPYENYYTADEIDEKIGDVESLLSQV